MPPSLARFSTTVDSLKYPIQAGIPNPKDTPKREESIKMLEVALVLISINVSEEKTPSVIQKIRRGVLLRILSAKTAPIRAENAAPPKFALHTTKVSK